MAAACWGSGTVISKQAVAEIPPLTLLAVQLAVSVGFLGITGSRRPNPTGRRPREVVLLGRLGLLNPGLAYALSLVGLTQISASVSVLLWATEPMLILGLAAVVLRERVTPTTLVATAIAVAGLTFVVLEPAAGGTGIGIALTIAGVAVCAVYSVATRRWLPGTSDSTERVVLAQQVHALAFAVAIVAIVALAGGPVMPAAITIGGLASAGISGLLYYSIAYLAYLGALRTLPAGIAAGSFYLVPVFGVGLAAVVGERLEPIQWLGAAVVVGAVAVITARGAAAVQPSSASASTHTATAPRAASRL